MKNKVLSLCYILITFFVISEENMEYKKIVEVKNVPNCYYYNNHTYIYVNIKNNWHKSKEMSKKTGGYLVVVNNIKENINIRKIIKGSTWLGFSDERKEGDYEWVNGDKVTFTYWANNEPNNAEGGQDYALMFKKFDYKWDDQTNNSRHYFICEINYIVDISDLKNKKKLLYNIEKDEMIAEITKTIEEKKLDHINVKKEDEGLKISIENINFKPDSYILEDSEKKKLEKLGTFLKKYKDKKIKIIGHTAKIGTKEECEKFSEKRAAVVANFLIKLNVVKKQNIIIIGKGYNEPIADNSTEQGRKKNRRVEMFILNE